MQLTWQDADSIELRPGYYLIDAAGEQVQSVGKARVAAEGGFLHVHIQGSAIQIISAPALWHITLSPIAKTSGWANR